MSTHYDEANDVLNVTIPIPGDLARTHLVSLMGIDELIEFIAQYLTEESDEDRWGIVCCGETLGIDLPKKSALAHLEYLTGPNHTPKLSRRVTFKYTDWSAS
jgi:hypothetical protein